MVGVWIGVGSAMPTYGETVPQGSPATSSSSSYFEIAASQNGWPENAVTAIVQTRQGYLWLATYHGLVRFDGVRFTVFSSGNTSGLANGLITSLHEDSSGVLWVGHETGEVSRRIGDRFAAVSLGTNWPGGVVEAITSDQDEDVWLMNDTGVFYRVRDGRTAVVPGGASPTRKVAVARTQNGKVWLVANGNIATLAQGKVVPFQLRVAQPGEFFERVLPAGDGGLWVLGNQRLRKYQGGHWVAELSTGSPAPGNVSTLFETSTGDILAGTLRDGLLLLRLGEQPTHFDRANGLSHNWVRALCEDHEGNIWVGTGAGFNSLHRRKVQILQPPDDWQGCAVLSLAPDSDGSAWIGTEGAGLYHFANGQWSSFGGTNGLLNLYVWSVLQTRSHQLLVGTWGGGLLGLQGDRFQSEADMKQITAPVVSLFEGSDGEIWVGTTSGLFRFEHGKLTWSAGKDKLAYPDIRAIAQTSDGAVWFGMIGGGLGRVKRGRITQYRKADGLGSDFVVCLYAETDNTLWLGTSDHGLVRLKQGRFAGISTAQGLPSDIICHIVGDGRGDFWMGSHRGIFRAALSELNRCADGLTRSVPCLSYGKAEGMETELCSGGFQPGAALGADGQLWFPTAKGVAIVDPSNVAANTNIPPVVIEEVRVDNQLMTAANGSHPLEIPAGKHRIEIRYTGLSFVAPEKVQFRYRLEGLDSDWKEVGTTRVAEYSYLPPTSYTFRASACNNDGLWNEKGASLAFVVLPFFWETWWFQIAAAVACAGAVGAGALWASRLRMRRKVEQLERQRALERERARIARDIHDDLGASLTRITMLSQSVRSEVEALPDAAADADQIYGTARELTRALDEIVWAVNPKHDTLDSLVTYLGGFAQQFLSTAGIRCRLDVPVNLPSWALTSEVRHNVFLAFKECLHNVLKHARATEVRVSLELQPTAFDLIITDNGRGFDPQNVKLNPASHFQGGRLAVGNGLQNMRRRLQEIGGHCEWKTAPGEGTRVKLSVRIQS